MATGFFSRLFGGKMDMESIRAEIRRIEREIGESFSAEAFKNGEWFLQNFHRFVTRYQNNWDRIRALEAAHPERDEDRLADLLIDEAVRTSTLAGGAAGAAVSATGIVFGAAAALAEMVFMVNTQLQLTFDTAAINGITISAEEPEEMLVIFASALGIEKLDLRGSGEVSELAMLAQSAARYHGLRWLAKRIGYEIVKRAAIKNALPVVNVGVSAYLSRTLTAKVGRNAKIRFGKLRQMKDRIFELRPRIGDREKDALLAAVTYLQSDGALTLEELYLVQELARSLQATALWQQLLAGEIGFDPATFINSFRDPHHFDQREMLLSVLQIVSETKMQPNTSESEFLRKLVQD
jgi:hypothetical protein